MKKLLRSLWISIVGFFSLAVFAFSNLFSTLFHEQSWEDRFNPDKQLGLKIKRIFLVIKRIGIGIMAIVTLPIIIVFVKIIFCRRGKEQ